MENVIALNQLQELSEAIHRVNLGAHGVSIVYNGDPLVLLGCEPVSDEWVEKLHKESVAEYLDTSALGEDMYCVGTYAEDYEEENKWYTDYFRLVEKNFPNISYVRFYRNQKP